MSYDFDKLQTIDCADSITMRVPARWQFEASGDGADAWCCFEDGVETGTLWINIERFQLRTEDDGEPEDVDMRFIVEQWAEQRSTEAPSPIRDSKITETAGGHLWTYNYESVEDGERLHNIRHIFFLFHPAQCAILAFNLVLLESQMADPEFRTLIEMMDREIRSARIDPFSLELSNESDPLASSRRVNFGNQVALDLPQTLRVRSEGKNRWYCFFEPEVIEARLWVMSHEMILGDEGSKEPVSVDPDLYGDIVRQVLGDEAPGENEMESVPNGILINKVYPFEGANELDQPVLPANWREGPMRHHLWHYFRFGDGKLREVQFLLMLPIMRAEAPKIISFIELLDREIRRADFPGIESDAT